MTSPPPADQRAALQVVTAAAVAKLTQLWPNLDLRDGAAVRDALKQILPPLVEEYGAAAAELAADVYTLLRDAAGITDPFDVPLVDPAFAKTLDKLVGWAVGPIFSEQHDTDMALYRITGGLQRVVANEYRDTIQNAAIVDRAAAGWQREARADGCNFCVMLAARGAVYTEKTVDFGAHRDCHCLAVPAFVGTAKPVKAYTPTDRVITAADRARVRRWIAQHQ